MGRKHTRMIGAAAALLAAGLAGFSLRSQQQHATTALAARNPAADVRTQVIQRTIHIVRHEHPKPIPAAHGTAAGGGAGGSPGSASPVRTGASGSRTGVVSSGPSTAVTTRTSAASAPAGGSARSGAPVTTRTSASHGSSGSSAPSSGPVTTRTSSQGGSTSGVGSSSVTTRSSGGHGGGHGGDGGGDNGGD